MTYQPTRLSAEAFRELRAIAESEIEPPMTDDEIEEMGVRLLRFFALLSAAEPPPANLVVTERELKALTFLREEIDRGRSPSVRDVSAAAGLRSSRSGFRLITVLLARGLVSRNHKGELRMTERGEVY